MSPTRLLGCEMSIIRFSGASSPETVSPTSFAAVRIASRYEPKSAEAARTAVAMAMPLVMALVVLPTASRSVSTCAPEPVTSPDISAMPCALSETGPKVSIATITPTVVSRPVPASATAKSASMIDVPPSRKAPYTPRPINRAV